MSHTTIGFFEREYPAGEDMERAELHRFLQDQDLSVTHVWEDLVRTGIPQLLFYHGNDRSKLGTLESRGAVFRDEVKTIYKIEYGGLEQSRNASAWDKDRVTRYINVRNLREWILGFVDDIQRLNELDQEVVHALIMKHFFTIDSELEKLLTPFATSSPFKAPKDNQAKTKLGEYITRKLGGTGS